MQPGSKKAAPISQEERCLASRASSHLSGNLSQHTREKGLSSPFSYVSGLHGLKSHIKASDTGRAPRLNNSLEPLSCYSLSATTAFHGSQSISIVDLIRNKTFLLVFFSHTCNMPHEKNTPV